MQNFSTFANTMVGENQQRAASHHQTASFLSSGKALPSDDVMTRMDELEDRLELSLRHNATLQQRVVAMEAKQKDADAHSSELYRRLGELVVTTSGLSEKLQLLDSTTFASLHEMLGEGGNGGGGGRALLDDVRRVLGSYKQEITRVSTQMDVIRRKCEWLPEDEVVSGRFLTSEIEKVMGPVIEEHVRSQRRSLEDTVRRMEMEMEKRHKRLVESTHEAIDEVAKGNETVAPQIRTTQNDVLGMKEQVRQLGHQLETIRRDTTFENAVRELKDWLADIERKLISRTEVEETVLDLRSQVSTLKHSTTATEALLQQKLEVERNARESAFSQLASTHARGVSPRMGHN